MLQKMYIVIVRPHRSTTSLYYVCRCDLLPMQHGLPLCHDRKPCKTVEPIEMPFGLWTVMNLRNHVLDGGPYPPMGRGNFEGEGRLIVMYREWCPCAAAI